MRALFVISLVLELCNRVTWMHSFSANQKRVIFSCTLLPEKWQVRQNYLIRQIQFVDQCPSRASHPQWLTNQTGPHFPRFSTGKNLSRRNTLLGKRITDTFFKPFCCTYRKRTSFREVKFPIVLRLFLDGLKYHFLFLFGQLFTLVWKFSIFSRGEVGI